MSRGGGGAGEHQDTAVVKKTKRRCLRSKNSGRREDSDIKERFVLLDGVIEVNSRHLTTLRFKSGGRVWKRFGHIDGRIGCKGGSVWYSGSSGYEDFVWVVSENMRGRHRRQRCVS